MTALMCAAASGRCDVVTELISLGADVDIQTNASYFLFPIMTLANGWDPPPKYLCKRFLQLPNTLLTAYFPYCGEVRQ